MTTARQLADTLMKRLNHLEPRVHSAASGSIYIRFEALDGIGQLRIGDHPEKRSVGYRWQLRKDIDKYTSTKERGHRQHFYPWSDVEGLGIHIHNYANNWGTKPKGVNHGS